MAAAVRSPRDVLIYWAAYTGMRAGEIGALRVKDLDMLGGRVTVSESLSDVEGKLSFGRTKNGRIRAFRIPAFLREMVAAYLVGRPNDSNALVFTGDKGGPFRHANWYRHHFRPAVDIALPERLHGLRFHDLRHTCAAILIAQGMHPKAISDRLGHSSIAITVDRYGHLFPDHDDAMMEGLETVYQAVLASQRGLSASKG